MAAICFVISVQMIGRWVYLYRAEKHDAQQRELQL
jgi:hypothetical protein